MAKRNRDLARRGGVGDGAGAVAAGSGQATRRADPVALARRGAVVHRVVPAQLACRIGARARAGERNAWAAVASIALGSFALVFSEVIPVGLLGDISGHLRVSIGTGGLMVVVPAAAAAVAAPVLALCSARLERRGVLVGLSALVVVCGRDRRHRAGRRGDARGPRRAGDRGGRVLGVRGRGRDQPGERAGAGHRGGGGQARGSSSRRSPADARRRR